MVCKKCGAQLPDEAKRCSVCNKKVKKGHPVLKAFLILLGFVIAAPILAVGTYAGTYYGAHHFAQKGEFAIADKLLILPELTAEHDSALLNFIDKGMPFEEGRYSVAMYQLDRLIESGYEPAANAKAALIPEAYTYAVDFYHTDDNVAAQLLFTTLEGYEDSSKYLLLLAARTGTLEAEQAHELTAIWDFEDAAAVIPKDNIAMCAFMEGKWQTEDGKMYFNLSENHKATFNLPYKKVAKNNKYAFSGGNYYSYWVETFRSITGNKYSYERNPRNVFRFTIEDYNTVTVFCYEDNSTYTLHRQ